MYDECHRCNLLTICYKNSGNIVQDLYNDLVIDYTNRLISVV